MRMSDIVLWDIEYEIPPFRAIYYWGYCGRKDLKEERLKELFFEQHPTIKESARFRSIKIHNDMFPIKKRGKK